MRARALLVANVLLATFAATRVASAQEMIRYETRAGDTCPAIAERLYGSASRIDVIHTFNPLGALPHRFPAGRVLNLPRVPPPARPMADAEVERVRNEVHAYTPGDHRARVREPINRGNRVGTLADSSAEVVLGNERALQLEEHTLVVILGRYSFQTQRRESAADTELVQGTLRSRLGALSGRPSPQPTVVTTPAASVAASPGETVVSVDRARSTRVAVLSGHSEVVGHRHRVVVAEGFGNRTDPGRSPSPPHRLPLAPTWSSDSARLYFTTAGSVAIHAEYRLTEGSAPVAHWRVQMARDPLFADLVVDRSVESSVTAFEARDLPPGRFFLRVRGIDADAFEGPTSEPRAFRVVSPAVAPGGPGRRAAIVVDDGLFCGLDAAALTEVHGPIPLAPARAHVLICADAADGRQPVQFEVAAGDSGPIVASARLLTNADWNGDDGRQPIAIRVMDAIGTPLPGVNVAVRVDGRGTISTPVAAAEPGTWFATMSRRRDDGASRLVIAAHGADVGALDVPPPPPAPVQGAPEPLPAPRMEPRTIAAVPDRGIVDFGASVGALPTLTRLGTGLGVALQGRYRLRFSWGEIAVGGHAGFERFDCRGGVASSAGYCMGATGAPQDLQVTVEALSLGVPFALLTRIGRSLVPYASVQPQLVIGRVSVSGAGNAVEPARAAFGLAAVVGVQFESAPHAPFIELGYRLALLPDSRLDAVPLSGIIALVGYRVIW